MKDDYTELKEQYEAQFCFKSLGKNRRCETYTDCAKQIREVHVKDAYAEAIGKDAHKQANFNFESFCNQRLPLSAMEDAVIDVGVRYNLTPLAVRQLYFLGELKANRQENYVICLELKENSSFKIDSNEIWDPKTAVSPIKPSAKVEHERSPIRLRDAIHSNFHSATPEAADKIARLFLSANPNAQVTEVIAGVKKNQYKISHVDGESYLVDAVAITRPEATQPEQPKEVRAEKPQIQPTPERDNRNMVHIDKAGMALSQDILRVAIAYILISMLILSLTNIIMMPLAYQAIIFLIITPLIAAKIIEKIFGWQTMEVVRR
jgi:hypothetical protein